MLTKETAFEAHLARRTVASQQFYVAGAKHSLHMAAKARSRTIPEVHAGQLVYYVRRGQRKGDQGYRAFAKVIAVAKRGKAVHPWSRGSAILEHSFGQRPST